MNAEVLQGARIELVTQKRPAASPSDLAPLPGGCDPSQWEGKSAPARRFILPGWIVRGSAGLLGGMEGVGKSLLAQQMATCAAAGLPFLGLDIEHVPSIYITCEDPTEELWRRQESINAALGISMGDLAGRLRTHSLKGHLGNDLSTSDEHGLLQPTARYHQIRSAAIAFGANLLFLDNAAHLFPGNENARHEVATFLGLLEKLSEEIDGAVVLLAHPNKEHAKGNKQGNEYSGSTGWSAHVRNRLFIDYPEPAEGTSVDEDMRVLRRSKANYAARGEEIQFLWHQWAFVRPNDVPVNIDREQAANAKAASENDRFLRLLDILTEQKRNVSHSPNGSNFAPKVMAGMTEAGGLSREAFKRAMERLFGVGAIVAGEKVWEDRHRKPVLGLARSRSK
jgi:RecA-family ATPase